MAGVCREHEIAQTTYYKWKQKYGGMKASDIKRLRELEEENRKTKQLYAELSLDQVKLKEVLHKRAVKQEISANPKTGSLYL